MLSLIPAILAAAAQPLQPVVRIPPRSPRRASHIDRAAIVNRYREDCPYPRGANNVKVYRLDAQSSLVLFSPCPLPVQRYALAFIAEESGNLRPAEFVIPARIEDDGNIAEGNLVANPAWDAAARRLRSLSAQGPEGLCGTRQSYVWDGRRFQLAEQATADCDGIYRWTINYRRPGRSR
jgi:hypothetical protein